MTIAEIVRDVLDMYARNLVGTQAEIQLIKRLKKINEVAN